MTAVGLRVKSGFAIAVVVAGSREAPQPIARCVVSLSDPEVAETRQPFHHGLFTIEEDAREIARRVRIVRRCAKASTRGLIDDIRRGSTASARPAIRAALVVGSLIDPERVGNPHIRAHAHEGRLFRTVLEAALQSQGVSCMVFLEKEIASRAASDLNRPAAAIARMVAAFGKSLGGPWRMDEKAAATAAWLALERSLPASSQKPRPNSANTERTDRAR